MENEQYVKKIIETNASIGILLGVLFFFSYWIFPASIKANLSELIFPTYLFLALGITFYFLLQDINLKLASVFNVIILPFSGLLFLYGRWLAKNTQIFQQFECASLTIATYTALLILYFAGSLYLHKKHIKE